MKSIKCPTMFNYKSLPLAVALTMSSIAAANADYPSTVLADHPIAYYRFEETSGTSVADSSASGLFPATYFYSTDNLYPELGQPGIDTNSMLLSAADPAFVYSGYYPELNEQAPFSFEIWARPTSVDPVNYRCPVGNFSGWSAAQISGWYIYQTPGTPSSSTFAFITASGTWITYTGVTPGDWYYLAGTYDGTNCSFYVNGTLVGTEATPGYLANSTAGNYNSLGIGERGDDSQFFDGNLDEFAYYTNALTAAQVLSHYQVGTNSFRVATNPPSILQDVISSVNAYAGHSVQFSVQADGTAPLAYQWYKGVAPIDGATSNVLVFTCAPADNGATYYVHISNAYGSTNSSTATLSVSTGLEIDAPLTSITRNVGSAAAFEIVADGALPISYQWYNGASPITGATNQILWLSNVQLTNNGASYYVAIINPYTSTNSDPATLNVQARAANAPTNGYAAVVEADGPVAYWRLDETNGSTNAVDTVGSFNGSYVPGAGSFTFGMPTGIPNDTDTAVGITGGATVSIPYSIEINPSGAFTVEGWFQPASVTSGGNDYRTAISSMSNPYGIGPTGWLVYQTAGNNWAWWPYNGYYNGIQLTDYDQVVANEWYYLAMVYDGTNFTFYVNGVAEASGTDSAFVQNGNVPSGGAANYNYNYNSNSISGFPTSEAFTIGQRVDDAFNPFDGTIDDVAVYNKALTPQQIQDHFLNTTHLVAAMSGNNIVITWGAGTLQSATDVSGPYTDVGGAAPPSYTNSVSGAQQRFYRVQLQ